MNQNSKGRLRGYREIDFAWVGRIPDEWKTFGKYKATMLVVDRGNQNQILQLVYRALRKMGIIKEHSREPEENFLATKPIDFQVIQDVKRKEAENEAPKVTLLKFRESVDVPIESDWSVRVLHPSEEIYHCQVLLDEILLLTEREPQPQPKLAFVHYIARDWTFYPDYSQRLPKKMTPIWSNYSPRHVQQHLYPGQEKK